MEEATRNTKDVSGGQFRYFVEMNSDTESYARGEQGIFWLARPPVPGGVSRSKRPMPTALHAIPKVRRYQGFRAEVLEHRIDSWMRESVESAGYSVGSLFRTKVPSKVPLDFLRFYMWLNLKEIGTRRTRLRS